MKKGFARNNYWEYLGIVNDNDEVSVRFGLKDTQIPQEARSAWAHSFRLTYTVSLTAKSIKTFIHLKNEDEDTFEFNLLLHTYFSVPVSRPYKKVTTELTILQTRILQKLLSRA